MRTATRRTIPGLYAASGGPSGPKHTWWDLGDDSCVAAYTFITADGSDEALIDSTLQGNDLTIVSGTHSWTSGVGLNIGSGNAIYNTGINPVSTQSVVWSAYVVNGAGNYLYGAYASGDTRRYFKPDNGSSRQWGAGGLKGVTSTGGYGGDLWTGYYTGFNVGQGCWIETTNDGNSTAAFSGSCPYSIYLNGCHANGSTVSGPAAGAKFEAFAIYNKFISSGERSTLRSAMLALRP